MQSDQGGVCWEHCWLLRNKTRGDELVQRLKISTSHLTIPPPLLKISGWVLVRWGWVTATITSPNNQPLRHLTVFRRLQCSAPTTSRKARASVHWKVSSCRPRCRKHTNTVTRSGRCVRQCLRHRKLSKSQIVLIVWVSEAKIHFCTHGDESTHRDVLRIFMLLWVILICCSPNKTCLRFVKILCGSTFNWTLKFTFKHSHLKQLQGAEKLPEVSGGYIHNVGGSKELPTNSEPAFDLRGGFHMCVYIALNAWRLYEIAYDCITLYYYN